MDEKQEICRILRIPKDSTYQKIRKRYWELRDSGFYNKASMRRCYIKYCWAYLHEVFSFYTQKSKLLLKILYGSGLAIWTLYSSFHSGITDPGQVPAIVFASMYLFCGGWGIEALTMIQLIKVNKIPFIGLQVYVVLKLGLGTAIGGIVVFVRMLRWIGKKFYIAMTDRM